MCICYVYMYCYILHVHVLLYITCTYTQVAGGSTGRRVSYPYFKAFNQMLGNLALFRNVVQAVCDHEGKATQGMVCIHVHPVVWKQPVIQNII